MKKTFFYFSVGIAALSVLLIIFLATGLWKYIFYPRSNENVKTKIVTPREATLFSSTGQTGQVSWEENISTKVPLDDGETVIAVLNKESEENMPEEQFVVYRTPNANDPMFITFLGYDENTRNYKRFWNAPTTASQGETITVFSQDLVGDRNNCIIVNGMNEKERTYNDCLQAQLRKGGEYSL